MISEMAATSSPKADTAVPQQVGWNQFQRRPLLAGCSARRTRIGMVVLDDEEDNKEHGGDVDPVQPCDPLLHLRRPCMPSLHSNGSRINWPVRAFRFHWFGNRIEKRKANGYLVRKSVAHVTLH